MSRQGVSPEEMMSVAKTMAKGEGMQGADSGNESSYQTNNQQSGYDGSSGQQAGYEDASGQQGGYSNMSDQQGNFDTMSGQQGGFEDNSGQQGGYADASGQQGGYTDPSGQQMGAMSNVDASSQSGNDYSNNENSSYSGPSGSTGRTGLQAQGAGLGTGFDQGFGQGLIGDVDGSEPHEDVQVQEEVAPDSTSRDTDLHTTGNASGGGYETHQHHHDSFATKSYVQGS